MASIFFMGLSFAQCRRRTAPRGTDRPQRVSMDRAKAQAPIVWRDARSPVRRSARGLARERACRRFFGRRPRVIHANPAGWPHDRDAFRRRSEIVSAS